MLGPTFMLFLGQYFTKNKSQLHASLTLDSPRYQSSLETYYMLRTGVTGLGLLKYVVIRRIGKIIRILGITDSLMYFH